MNDLKFCFLTYIYAKKLRNVRRNELFFGISFANRT
jgi:hypothetical protein